MNFGERIVGLRKERRISRQQLADDLGIPYTTLRNYEKNEREAGHALLLKLADYFEVSIDYLLGLVNEPFHYVDNNRSLEEINSYETKPVPPLTPTAYRIGRAYDQAPLPVQRTVAVALEPYLNGSAEHIVQAIPGLSNDRAHEDEALAKESLSRRYSSQEDSRKVVE